MITHSARRLGTVLAADDGTYTFTPADITEDPAPSRRSLTAALSDAAAYVATVYCETCDLELSTDSDVAMSVHADHDLT